MTALRSDTEPRSGRGRRRWPYLVAAALAGIGLGLLALAMLRPHVYAGAVLQSSGPAPPMTELRYADGGEVDLAALRGEVVLVYFGYTHCPDVCPTMLSAVARAVEGLGAEGERVTTMMVTVDPGRDTPDLLAEYVAHFDDGFRGVWGPEDDVRSVATRYGVIFEHDEPGADGSYLVSHTASLMAIDPEGALRIVYPVGVTADDLQRDLAELLG